MAWQNQHQGHACDASNFLGVQEAVAREGGRLGPGPLDDGGGQPPAGAAAVVSALVGWFTKLLLEIKETICTKTVVVRLTTAASHKCLVPVTDMEALTGTHVATSVPQ
jgi:hypothetical protein